MLSPSSAPLPSQPDDEPGEAVDDQRAVCLARPGGHLGQVSHPPHIRRTIGSRAGALWLLPLATTRRCGMILRMMTEFPIQGEVHTWCLSHLGSGVDQTLFHTGHLSEVVGVRLTDGRRIVVKIRPPAARLAACAQVQQALWQAGIPCPRPLAGPEPLGERTASAESLIRDGQMLGPDGDAVHRYAELLARFIRLAPDPSGIGPLAPNPPWTAWDHDHDGVWHHRTTPTPTSTPIRVPPGSTRSARGYATGFAAPATSAR